MMRTITVRGVGNVSARPDYITISMTIESIRKDYDGAMRDASERISKLQDVAVRSRYEMIVVNLSSSSSRLRAWGAFLISNALHTSEAANLCLTLH